MAVRRMRAPLDGDEALAGFARIRKAMDLPAAFPPEVEREALAAAERDPVGAGDHEDRTDIPFVTIDPAGSMDLDQAFHAERIPSGFRVDYAIADPGWFIEPGSALDGEGRRRGQTLYSPDLRVPLYPTVLSESTASLLPDRVRPAMLWSIELNDSGTPTSYSVRRSLVRAGRRLTYAEAQEEIDGTGAEASLGYLRDIGLLRKERERQRGGMNLELPEQEIVPVRDGFELRLRAPLPVEEWNAQISLLTGMCAAALMLEHRIGLLRTMPSPEPETVTGLRAAAQLVGVEWSADTTYQNFISQLDATKEGHATLLTLATRLFRGTGYVAFDGEVPDQPLHHAIAAPYAHVTAPLRRLADRFANEVAVSLCAGTPTPPWVTEGLSELPAAMKDSHRRAGELERRSLDYIEALALADRVGDDFEAVVLESGAKGSVVQICEPAVVARCGGACGDLGDRLVVRLVEANVERGTVQFESSEAPG